MTTCYVRMCRGVLWPPPEGYYYALKVFATGLKGNFLTGLIPLPNIMANMKWLVWPVSLAVMSRVGRYLPYGVAVLGWPL